MSGVPADAPARPLDGLRVLDFGQYLAGPMVAMFLADFGAEVIHVDPPGGLRWDHPANAALQRGKRSVTLDLKDAADLAEARRLLSGADVVVENFRPGVMARLGLDPAAAREADPRLIWCSLPGFAADDPRAALAAWEGVVCAAAGLYAQPLFAEGDPVFTALPLASNFGAFLAAHRIAGALIARRRGAPGEHIECSLYEACFQAIGFHADTPRSRDFADALNMQPHIERLLEPRLAADGAYVYFDTPLRGVQAFIDHFIPGPRLVDLDPDSALELGAELDRLIAQKPALEWERIGQEEIKGSFGLVQSSRDWLDDRHALESGCVLEVEDAELGPTRQAGHAVRLSRTPAAVAWGRGGEPEGPDRPIGWTSGGWDADEAETDGAGGPPLTGVRVLDCSTLLAGPTTARILAQYGAEVIKVDRTGIITGEVDPLSDDPNAFVGARTVNAGKRMAFVDLKDPRGQELVSAIAAGADIVHHNFTPAAAEKLGLGPDRLRALRPDVIVSTMSLHSHGGYRAEYRGHDMVAQMLTGIGARMGGDGPPQDISLFLNDNAAGHLHAFGLMLALLHRRSSGEGQDVNGSLSRTSTMHQVPFLVGHEGRVWDEPTGPEAPGWSAVDRLYRAADGWLYLSVGPAGDRAALAGCPILAGVTEVADEDLAGWLGEAFARHTVDDCVVALGEAGVVAHRCLTLDRLATDPAVLGRRLMVVVEHPGLGRALGTGLPVLEGSSTEDPGVLVMRRPGMDTAEILAEHGFGERLEELRQDRVVATEELDLLITTNTSDYWKSGPVGNEVGFLTVTPAVLDAVAEAPEVPVFVAPGSHVSGSGASRT